MFVVGEATNWRAAMIWTSPSSRIMGIWHRIFWTYASFGWSIEAYRTDLVVFTVEKGRDKGSFIVVVCCVDVDGNPQCHNTFAMASSSLKRTQQQQGAEDSGPNEKSRREQCPLLALPDNLKMEVVNELRVQEKFQTKLLCEEFVQIEKSSCSWRKYRTMFVVQTDLVEQLRMGDRVCIAFNKAFPKKREGFHIETRHARLGYCCRYWRIEFG